MIMISFLSFKSDILSIILNTVTELWCFILVKVTV